MMSADSPFRFVRAIVFLLVLTVVGDEIMVSAHKHDYTDWYASNSSMRMQGQDSKVRHYQVRQYRSRVDSAPVQLEPIRIQPVQVQPERFAPVRIQANPTQIIAKPNCVWIRPSATTASLGAKPSAGTAFCAVPISALESNDNPLSEFSTGNGHQKFASFQPYAGATSAARMFASMELLQDSGV